MNVVSEDPAEVVLEEPGLVGRSQDHDAVVEGLWVDARGVGGVEGGKGCGGR